MNTYRGNNEVDGNRCSGGKVSRLKTEDKLDLWLWWEVRDWFHNVNSSVAV